MVSIRCLLSSVLPTPSISSFIMSPYNTRSKKIFSVREAMKLAIQSAKKSRPSKRTILVDIDPMFYLKGRLDALVVKANITVSISSFDPFYMLLIFRSFFFFFF